MNTHTKAFLTNFEIACEFAILAIVGDLVWLIGDVYYGEMRLHHWFVGVFLIIAIIGTAFAMYRHHKAYTHRFFKKEVSLRQYSRWDESNYF